MMEYKFTIPGQLPGLNEYIDLERAGAGRYRANSLKKETQEAIHWALKGSALRGVRLEVPVTIHYLWIEPNRKRDKDNIAFAKKFIQDALVKAEVLPNDGWRHIAGFSDDFSVDTKNPRVEVRIVCQN